MSQVPKNLAALLDASTVFITVRFADTDVRTYNYFCNVPGVVVGSMVVVPVHTIEKYADQRLTPDHWDYNKQVKLAVVTSIEPEITPEFEKDYAWVIQVLDFFPYIKLMDRNEELVKTVAASYKANLRRSFADTFLSGLSDESKASLSSLMKLS